MATPRSITIPPALPGYELTSGEMTDAGVGIRSRPPALSIRAMALRELRRQLERGPFLAAFDAGMCDIHDVAPRTSRVVVLGISTGEAPAGPRVTTRVIPYSTIAEDAAAWTQRIKNRDDK